MNIFFLDEDIKICAQYHCNKHLVKMILEHAQILSTANRMCGLNEGYKVAHLHHPSVQWAQECFENWYYLKNLTLELEEELVYRGYSRHRSAQVVRNLSNPHLPIIGGITYPPKCMPKEYKEFSYIQSYRNYYIGEKQHIADWGIRGEPWWFKRR